MPALPAIGPTASLSFATSLPCRTVQAAAVVNRKSNRNDVAGPSKPFQPTAEYEPRFPNHFADAAIACSPGLRTARQAYDCRLSSGSPANTPIVLELPATTSTTAAAWT